MRVVSILCILLVALISGGLYFAWFHQPFDSSAPPLYTSTPPQEITPTPPPDPTPTPTPAPLLASTEITPSDIDLIPFEKPLIDIDAVHPLPNDPPAESFQAKLETIPKQFFPNKTTLKNKTILEIKSGGTTSGKVPVDAGKEVDVTSASGNTITVSQAIAEATLPHDQTDFFERFAQAYNEDLARRTQAIQAERDKAKQFNDNQIKIRADKAALLGPAPLVKSDGTVPLILDAIQSGPASLKDLKPEKITAFGKPTFEYVGGKPYWTVKVSYTVDAALGEMKNSRIALIQSGKFIRWSN